MNSIKLKVCGMRDHENIMNVAALHPDYMGFIFYPKSPRYVGSAFKLPKDFPSAIKRVGVFVNASVAEMIDQVRLLQLDYLQLHGDEPVEHLRELKKQGLGIIKAFSVDDAFDFTITQPYQEYADYLLFDTKGKYYGGNATTFNWSVLQSYNQQTPFLLSGGLSPENMNGIKSLQSMNLHALDVNSGVEILPAMKDVGGVKEVQVQLKNINV